MASPAPEPPESRDAAVDVHSTAGKLADLHRRNDEAVHAGSEQAVEKEIPPAELDIGPDRKSSNDELLLP